MIKYFLDKCAYKREVEKIKQEREVQKDAKYLEKRIEAYEEWIAHFASCITSLTVLLQQNGNNSAPLFDGKMVMDMLINKQAQRMAALKMFGHPKVYEHVEGLVIEFNKLSQLEGEARQTHLTTCAQKLEEIATMMRQEINRILCGNEEICV
jgi:hypothetical protein